MKKFEVPEVETVYFEQKDIITESVPCGCVECTVCPDGKDNCTMDDGL